VIPGQPVPILQDFVGCLGFKVLLQDSPGVKKICFKFKDVLGPEREPEHAVTSFMTFSQQSLYLIYVSVQRVYFHSRTPSDWNYLKLHRRRNPSSSALQQWLRPWPWTSWTQNHTHIRVAPGHHVPPKLVTLGGFAADCINQVLGDTLSYTEEQSW